MRHGQLRPGLTGIAARTLVLAGIGVAGPAATAAPKPGTVSRDRSGQGVPARGGNVTKRTAGL